jgi:hypothetical protein
MPKQQRTPFDVKLNAKAKEELGIFLATELDNAINARSWKDQDLAYFHTLYEQGRTRGGTNSPWPDAADLTSPIGTEKVDALRSRIVRTIFSETIWTVEGWGEAATKAPLVEEFHNWQAEAMGFQAAFAKAVHLSLIEPQGVLEVYEESLRRPIRKQIRAALQLDPATGAAMVGEDLQPMLAKGPDGRNIEAPEVDPATQMPIPSADVVVDDYELVSNGPRVRVIPSRDFLTLPGHACDKSQVWGYAKRFYRSIASLKERVEAGVYDVDTIEALGRDDEKPSETSLAGEPVPVSPKEGDLAEKELFEVTFLHELDKTGLRWYVATVHKDKRLVLRVNYDDIGRPRYFPLVPFPKPNSVEGYSFIGHKLITVIEENTAWRNMLTDRASLQVQAPMKRRQGALWDPDDQPLGPKSVITVRDMDEVQALELPDYTAPARERIIDTERQAEKLAGMTDIASGSQPNEDRTLGETQLIAVNSEVRIDEVVRNIQEPLEDIAQVLNIIWKRTLAESPEGIDVPTSVLQGLETRGADVSKQIQNKKFTAAMLEGAYKFKPKGSVETADKPRQQMLFNQGLQALATIAQANTSIGLVLQQPLVGKALLEKWCYLYNITDKQAFLGSAAMQLLQMQMATPGMPGMPGGAPPSSDAEVAPGGPPRPPGPPQGQPPQMGAPAQ